MPKGITLLVTAHDFKEESMSETQRYDDAVRIIKTAILQSQYDAARSVNEKQLMLYYGIGKYISMNSREGFWGKGAIDAISERLEKELRAASDAISHLREVIKNGEPFSDEWCDAQNKLPQILAKYDELSEQKGGG